MFWEKLNTYVTTDNYYRIFCVQSNFCAASKTERLSSLVHNSNFDFRYPAYKVKPAYLRVYNDSMLKYSARVNYDVACPMHFEKYPVDIQRCNVSFESWGHTNHYIMLSWLYEKRKFSKSIALAQFGLDLHFIEEPPSAFGSLGKFFLLLPFTLLFPSFFVLWYTLIQLTIFTYFVSMYIHIQFDRNLGMIVQIHHDKWVIDAYRIDFSLIVYLTL